MTCRRSTRCCRPPRKKRNSEFADALSRHKELQEKHQVIVVEAAARHNDLQQKYEILQTTSQNREHECADALSRHNDLQEKHEAVVAEAEKADASLQKKHNDLQKKHNVLHASLQQRDVDVSDAASKQDTLQKSYGAAQASLQRRDVEFAQATSRHEALQRKHDAMVLDHQATRHDRDMLTQQLSQNEEVLQGNCTKLDEAKAAIEQSKFQSLEMEARLAEQVSLVNDFQKEEFSLRENIVHLEAQSRQVDIEMSTHRRTNDELQGTISSHACTIEQLQGLVAKHQQGAEDMLREHRTQLATYDDGMKKERLAQSSLAEREMKLLSEAQQLQNEVRAARLEAESDGKLFSEREKQLSKDNAERERELQWKLDQVQQSYDSYRRASLDESDVLKKAEARLCAEAEHSRRDAEVELAACLERERELRVELEGQASHNVDALSRSRQLERELEASHESARVESERLALQNEQLQQDNATHREAEVTFAETDVELRRHAEALQATISELELARSEFEQHGVSDAQHELKLHQETIARLTEELHRERLRLAGEEDRLAEEGAAKLLQKEAEVAELRQQVDALTRNADRFRRESEEATCAALAAQSRSEFERALISDAQAKVAKLTAELDAERLRSENIIAAQALGAEQRRGSTDSVTTVIDHRESLRNAEARILECSEQAAEREAEAQDLRRQVDMLASELQRSRGDHNGTRRSDAMNLPLDSVKAGACYASAPPAAIAGEEGNSDSVKADACYASAPPAAIAGEEGDSDSVKAGACYASAPPDAIAGEEGNSDSVKAGACYASAPPPAIAGEEGNSVEALLREEVRRLQAWIESLQQDLSGMQSQREEEKEDVRIKACELSALNEQLSGQVAQLGNGCGAEREHAEEKLRFECATLQAQMRVAREQIREQVIMLQELQDAKSPPLSGVSAGTEELVELLTEEREERGKLEAKLLMSREAAGDQDAARGEIDTLRGTLRVRNTEFKEQSLHLQELRHELSEAEESRQYTKVDGLSEMQIEMDSLASELRVALEARQEMEARLVATTAPDGTASVTLLGAPEKRRAELLQTELQHVEATARERESFLRTDIRTLENTNEHLAQSSKEQSDELMLLRERIRTEGASPENNRQSPRVRENQSLREELLNKCRELATVQAEAESAADTMREDCNRRVKALEGQLRCSGMIPSAAGSASAMIGGLGHYSPAPAGCRIRNAASPTRSGILLAPSQGGPPLFPRHPAQVTVLAPSTQPRARSPPLVTPQPLTRPGTLLAVAARGAQAARRAEEACEQNSGEGESAFQRELAIARKQMAEIDQDLRSLEASKSGLTYS